MSIYEKLSKVQVELKAPKNLYNSFGKYKYRNAEGICEAVKPFLAKAKLALVLKDEIIEVGGRIYVKAIAELFDTEGTEKITATAYARESLEKKGMDDSQITGTASSYARKYALNGLFLLDDTKDADSDEYRNQVEGKKQKEQEEEKHEEKKKKIENQRISEVKVQALLARCESDGVNPNKILELYNVSSLADLTEVKFANINAHWDKIKE